MDTARAQDKELCDRRFVDGRCLEPIIRYRMDSQDWQAAGGVGTFLELFKAALEYTRTVRWAARSSRFDEVGELGLTLRQAEEVVKYLRPEHHTRGPEPDDYDPEATVNIFCYPLDAAEVYIKLSLRQHPKKTNVYVGEIWSFKRK